MATRLFTSFDYDYDLDLKTMLMGQSRHADTPFEIVDYSVKDHLPGDWLEKVRARIRRVEQVCFLCGEMTDRAAGVAAELAITRQESKPYFFLWGRTGRTCVKPLGAPATDLIYEWTWDNLRALLRGDR